MFKALSDLFNDPAGDPIEITVFEALGVWLGLMGLGLRAYRVRASLIFLLQPWHLHLRAASTSMESAACPTKFPDQNTRTTPSDLE